MKYIQCTTHTVSSQNCLRKDIQFASFLEQVCRGLCAFQFEFERIKVVGIKVFITYILCAPVEKWHTLNEGKRFCASEKSSTEGRALPYWTGGRLFQTREACTESPEQRRRALPYWMGRGRYQIREACTENPARQQREVVLDKAEGSTEQMTVLQMIL